MRGLGVLFADEGEEGGGEGAKGIVGEGCARGTEVSADEAGEDGGDDGGDLRGGLARWMGGGGWGCRYVGIYVEAFVVEHGGGELHHLR